MSFDCYNIGPAFGLNRYGKASNSITESFLKLSLLRAKTSWTGVIVQSLFYSLSIPNLFDYANRPYSLDAEFL